ncbi:HAD hydrolase family protein [Bacillus carboniphilus]|uniref:HAD hydrolase family protein n=1 Tax=Bacillus carboniphilus TaxID=86663 RepID=A0ABP3GKT0_9BACI
MIFASDLDRTLIYSTRALKEYNQLDLDLVLVESANNHQSYMSKESYEMLEEISRKILFIPVTTRTNAQFKRLKLPLAKSQNHFHITSNGAHIFVNGKKDLRWERKLQSKMENLTYTSFHIAEQIKELQIDPDKITIRNYQNLYFSITGKEASFKKEIKEWVLKVRGMGWKVYFHRNRCYIMPPFLKKGESIRYLKQELGENVVWGAGDSIMDSSLLQVCEQKYVRNMVN